MCNHTDTQRENAITLLVDGRNGIYSGQAFAELQPALYDDDGVLMAETLETLLAGPHQDDPFGRDRPEAYYEACTEIEQGYLAGEKPGDPRRFVQWIDGDLWAVRDDAEWCDECEAWVLA